MKQFLFIVIIIFLSFNLHSQISFFKAYSDFGYDKGEGIVQLEDSSYLITGSSSSFSNSSQAFILKVDSLGNRLWSKHYGGLESDKGKRIFYVPNDGIYVVGQTNSFPNTFYDGYFFKTDLEGNLIYEKHFGGEGFEDIHDAVMLEDTSFILVGETQSTENEVENMYIVRINKLGEVLWEKNFGTEGKDVARGIKVLTYNSVIIVGEYYVEDSLTQKAAILKMHISGIMEWLKVYGNAKGTYAINDFVIAQNRIKTVGYNQGIDPESETYPMRLITDLDGEFIDEGLEHYVGNQQFCLITDYNNPLKFFVTLQVKRSENFFNYDDGYDDLFIYRFQESLYYDGIGVSNSNYGQDQGNQIIKTSDGGAILVGYNQTPILGGSNVTLYKIGPNDLFPPSGTLPVMSTLVSINELDTKSPTINISPNPVENELNLSKIPFEIKSVSIYNQQGKKVLSKDYFQDKMDVQYLCSGMYFLVLENKNGSKNTFKFMKN